MSCHLHRDAILDFARGVTVTSDAVEGVRAHIETCPACAVDLRRQQALTTGLAELAADARAWSAPRDLEDRLVRSGHGIGPPSRSRNSGWWAAIGVAASFVLIVWTNWPDRAASLPDVPPASPIVVPPVTRGSERVPTLGTSPEPSARRATRIARRGSRPAAQSTARPLQFKWIPGAAALPTLESASIVRVELPVSALPAYGVQIVPDAVRSSVEADVLVGQDGQARGIRLITGADIVPRSRQ
jgi:hypothetical protein